MVCSVLPASAAALGTTVAACIHLTCYGRLCLFFVTTKIYSSTAGIHACSSSKSNHKYSVFVSLHLLSISLYSAYFYSVKHSFVICQEQSPSMAEVLSNVSWKRPPIFQVPSSIMITLYIYFDHPVDNFLNPLLGKVRF